MAKKKRIIQPVTFTEEEEYLLEYAKSQGKPYAVFIKDLIRKEIGEPPKHLTKDEVVKLIEENISKHTREYHTSTAISSVVIDAVKKEEDKKEGLGLKGKSAYKNLLRK